MPRALALLVSLALLTAACGGGGDAEQTTGSEAGAAATEGEGTGGGGGGGGGGGTLVIDKSFDLATADPHRQFETTGTIVAVGLYDTLLGFEGADVSEPVPLVAESYEVNDDATEYTFTIRDDIVFSDGSPLEAKDVVFSMNRVQNLAGNPSFLLEGAEISSPDDSTVVFTYAEPFAALPAILPNPSLGIVNSDVVIENGGTDADDAAEADTAEAFLNETSAGSGPYVLESFSTTTETVLAANPEYWGEAPGYDRIVIRNVEVPSQRLNVQQGTSQVVLDLSGDQLEGLDAGGNLQVLQEPSPALWFVFANANPEVSEVTANPDFQEAVRYGLDYEGILELTGEGSAQAAGVVPSQFVGALDSGDAVQRDVDRAREALERSGVADPTVTLEYPSDFTANGLSFGPIAERVQANLEEVGITVELAPAPIATALENYRAGTEEMGLWLWNPDYPDPVDYLVFTPGQLVGLRAGWAEGAAPEVETLADEAASTVEDDERAPIFQDIQTRLNESGPFFPLFQPTAAIVAANTVDGVQIHPSFIIDVEALRPAG